MKKPSEFFGTKKKRFSKLKLCLIFTIKQVCHLGRTAQQVFGQTVWPNQTFGQSLLGRPINILVLIQ